MLRFADESLNKITEKLLVYPEGQLYEAVRNLLDHAPDKAEAICQEHGINPQLRRKEEKKKLDNMFEFTISDSAGWCPSSEDRRQAECEYASRIVRGALMLVGLTMIRNYGVVMNKPKMALDTLKKREIGLLHTALWVLLEGN